MTKVFLIGGPGNTSRGRLDYLLERGYDLTVYTRNAAAKQSAHSQITFYEGDRRDAETLRRAFSDFGTEMVIDTICFEFRPEINLRATSTKSAQADGINGFCCLQTALDE